jgi:hypothetical protein
MAVKLGEGVVITVYKKVFSEYHNGTTSFIHILSKPIAATRDAATHQDDTDKLKEAVYFIDCQRLVDKYIR